MIIIHLKNYDFKYEGKIKIYCDDRMIYIDWSRLYQEDGEWITWASNGYDAFWFEDVLSIEGR